MYVPVCVGGGAKWSVLGRGNGIIEAQGEQHIRGPQQFWMVLNRSKPDEEDSGCSWRENKSSSQGLTPCISSFNPHSGPRREELLPSPFFWVRKLRPGGSQ